MVVVWGNILSLWGNVFAIAVDILVFDAFFPHNDNRKKRWSYILLFCLIFTLNLIESCIALAGGSKI